MRHSIGRAAAAALLAVSGLAAGAASAQDDSTPSTGVFKTAEEIHALCIPEGTQALTIRDVVIAYWQADPEGLQYSAVSTIYNALEAEYGC